jgi:hypothetical protein
MRDLPRVAGSLGVRRSQNEGLWNDEGREITVWNILRLPILRNRSAAGGLAGGHHQAWRQGEARFLFPGGL